MQTFKTTFSKYNNGQTRLSTPQWLSADDFASAWKLAQHMLHALQGADPDSQYSIACIDAQLRGIECNGARMFETTDELTERVKQQQGG